MPYATVDDVVARYEGVISDGQRDWVGHRLVDAEAVVHSAIPDLDARVESGRISTDMVRYVLCSMVLDVLRNPAGYKSQTAGEFSYSIEGGGAGSRMQLSAADRRALLGRARANTLPAADTALPHLLRRAREC